MTADPATKRSRPWVVGALALVLLGVTTALVVARLGLLDPYRPGTSHRATASVSSCVIPGDLYLDGRTWVADDPLPPDWPYPGPTAVQASSLSGTLDVTAEDQATFTPEHGTSVRYHRLAPDAFGDLRCPIR